MAAVNPTCRSAIEGCLLTCFSSSWNRSRGLKKTRKEINTNSKNFGEFDSFSDEWMIRTVTSVAPICCFNPPEFWLLHHEWRLSGHAGNQINRMNELLSGLMGGTLLILDYLTWLPRRDITRIETFFISSSLLLWNWVELSISSSIVKLMLKWSWIPLFNEIF